MSVLLTLLVDGTDIRSFSGVYVNRLDLIAPNTLRGGPDVIPGASGALGAALPFDTYTFAVEITLDATSEADFFVKLFALDTALAGDGGLVTLTRRVPTGTSTYADHTAKGQYLGGAYDLANVATGKSELQFTNLSGGWFNGSTRLPR